MCVHVCLYVCMHQCMSIYILKHSYRQLSLDMIPYSDLLHIPAERHHVTGDQSQQGPQCNRKSISMFLHKSGREIRIRKQRAVKAQSSCEESGADAKVTRAAAGVTFT